MTLRITLRDGDKMIINGAVVRANGRVELVIENKAAVMRGREVMTPDEATTPARRLYLACMMAYIHPEGLAGYQSEIITLLRELLEVLESAEAQATCVQFARKVALSDFYRALSDCRGLINFEAEVLARLDHPSNH